MKHYTDYTLSELLRHPDELVRRNAVGIEKHLYKKEMQSLEYTTKISMPCRSCNTNLADKNCGGLCKHCYNFYNQ